MRLLTNEKMTVNLMQGKWLAADQPFLYGTCAGLEIKQALTAYNNPKGNANAETMMHTLSKKSFAGCKNGKSVDLPIRTCDGWRPKVSYDRTAYHRRRVHEELPLEPLDMPNQVNHHYMKHRCRR